MLSVLKCNHLSKKNIWWQQQKKTDDSKQEQIRTEKHYIGIDSGNGSLKAFSDKGLSAKHNLIFTLPKQTPKITFLTKKDV